MRHAIILMAGARLPATLHPVSSVFIRFADLRNRPANPVHARALYHAAATPSFRPSPVGAGLLMPAVDLEALGTLEYRCSDFSTRMFWTPTPTHCS
jgi:hypothetical protein